MKAPIVFFSMSILCSQAWAQGTLDINQLPSAVTPLTGTELTPVYQSSFTKKAPAANLGEEYITMSWVPGQNLITTNGVSLVTLDTSRTIVSITCRPDSIVGPSGDAIDFWYAPSGTALLSGTELTNGTPVNVDGSLYTNVAATLGSSLTVPASSTIGFVASGSNWATSLGAGGCTIAMH